MRVVDGFHAYKSVAPLKRPPHPPHLDRQRQFPRLQKRGPIEAAGLTRRGASFPSFHAYKSVAPLKQLVRRVARHAYKRFPRLQKRGPIEASTRGAITVRCKWFPRLQKRGPIEALP